MAFPCLNRYRSGTAQARLPVVLLFLFLYSGQASSQAIDYLQYFPSGYSQARDSFLKAARAAGATVESFRHPLAGLAGESLYTDVALIGPVDAKSAIVLASGTHGVEGFAGSAIQTGLLRDGIASRLPPDTRLLMIHAVNPYGFAHRRRVNEDNVDINRNFVDHSTPYPANPGYEALADVMLPQSLSFWETTKARAKLLWYRLAEGELQLRRAVSQGQFTHPDGLFFGGNAEAWSNRTLTVIATRQLRRSEKVIFIGFHTGLGGFGTAEVIMNVARQSPAYVWAKACWSDIVRTTRNGESVSVQPIGPVKLAIAKLLPQAEVTAVSLEFGTFPASRVLWALRAENWLHHRGEREYPDKDQIKAELLRVFYPNDDSWKQAIWNKGKDVVDKAIVCLRNFSDEGKNVSAERRLPSD